MEWYRRWFGEEYLLVYEHRDRAEAETEIAFIGRVLGLTGGERVLDLCCGSGRHDLPLARLGCRVVGLDYSLPLLRIARNSATGGDWPRYVRADARNIPFRDGAFDVVLNLFTSFGYFTDRDNRDLLRSMARLLRPGGRFLIDYLNPPRVLAGLVPETERERNGICILERRTYNSDARRVEKTIVLRCEGREERFEESVRLYTFGEMREMLDAAGLGIEGTAGSSGGEEYSETSPRMILWGERK